MALLEKHLVVKKSTIPGSGKGLFTKVFIPRGTRIVEYKGKITSWNEVNHNHGKNGYIYYVNRNHVIDAAHGKTSVARYANDANGLEKIKGLNNNSTYRQDGLRVYITAKKNIPADSEILVNYGKEYWEVIRYNKKLSEKEAVKRKKNRRK